MTGKCKTDGRCLYRLNHRHLCEDVAQQKTITPCAEMTQKKVRWWQQMVAEPLLDVFDVFLKGEKVFLKNRFAFLTKYVVTESEDEKQIEG